MTYYDHRLPLSIASYAVLLREASRADSLDVEAKHTLQSCTDRAEAYAQTLLSGDEPAEAWEDTKAAMYAEGQQQRAVQAIVKEVTERYPRRPEQLRALLDQQHFRLVHWQTTEQEINYRRFFTVNDLICLNAQQPKVFEHYHQKIKEWVQQGYVQGVRIDHVDGLFDPTAYLTQLRALLGDEAYITVEKILEHEEHLPDHWPIQGSSGYEFLADVNQLFTDIHGGKSLLSYYTTWDTERIDYEEFVYRNKGFILQNRMHGELDNLMTLLVASELVPAEELSKHGNQWKEALGHLLIAFPVYRIYSTSFPFAATDLQVLNHAFNRALMYAPTLDSQLDQLQEIFQGEASADDERDQRRLQFVMRFQQFAGPLAAKGGRRHHFLRIPPAHFAQ